MAKEQIAVAEMILNMILGKTDGSSRVDFTPQKPKFPFDAPYEQPFPRDTPESQGISSSRLASMIRELDASKFTDMHHLMILRHGKVIQETSFAPYRPGIWHISHSMCKSITGMAIGMLIEENLLSLDENIFKIFEHKTNLLTKVFRPVITVESLLTMTSGVTFNESGIVSGNDWLGSYLNALLSGKPGTKFQYNSLNTYVLSAIVTERTGMTMEEYLRPRLFEPLGITKYFWETCPKGITKGGWGLFICPEDMAKLGQLYLQKGMWQGRQLVPAWWVEASTARHVDSQEGTFGYGYQIWMEHRPGSFEFNGMLGQNVIVYPDLDMVIVTSAGSNELFQNCAMLDIIRSYFPLDYKPADSLPENPCAFSLLNRLKGEIASGRKLSPRILHGGWQKTSTGRTRSLSIKETPDFHLLMRSLSGRKYELYPQSVGLFPLFIQVFHNNMTEGIQQLEFLYQKGSFYINFLESGQWHMIKAGFGCPEESWLTLHEESYLISTSAEFTRDENHTLVLKINMAYLEESVRRQLNIFFKEDGIELQWFETPGKAMIMTALSSVTDEISSHPIFTNLKLNGSLDVIHRLMGQTIEPIVLGTSIKTIESST